VFRIYFNEAQLASTRTTAMINVVQIANVDIFTTFQDLDAATIRLSNRYCNMISVGNLCNERIFNTCKDALYDQVQEQLVGVPVLEFGGILNLQFMLDLIMDIDDGALHSIMQNLQTLQMKDVTGRNVGTLLLRNCGKLPMNMMRLLSATFYSVRCPEFVNFKTLMYFSYKRRTKVITPMDFLIFNGVRVLHFI